MRRAKSKRTWIKLYPVDCLEGSIRWQLESDERGAWYDLLNYSALCAIPGLIADKDGRPFPHSFIANRLNITQELLKRTLKKCIEEGRIEENDSGIHIVNFEAYQSEYERQKPYREKKKSEAPQAPQDPQDPDFSELVKIYEENIGVLSPVIGGELKEVYKLYKKDYIAFSIEEAARANKKNWRYIEGVLMGLENEYGDVCKK